jgi:hypothetical protein
MEALKRFDAGYPVMDLCREAEVESNSLVQLRIT